MADLITFGIIVGGLAILIGLTWGITKIYLTIQDKIMTKRWKAAIAAHPEILEMRIERNRLQSEWSRVWDEVRELKDTIIERIEKEKFIPYQQKTHFNYETECLKNKLFILEPERDRLNKERKKAWNDYYRYLKELNVKEWGE